MKLQTKILAPILLLLAALQGGTGALSYLTARERLDEAFFGYMRTEGDGIILQYGALLENALRDVQRTAIRPEIREFLAQDIQDKENQSAISGFLKLITESYPDFSRMTIYDPDGKIVAASAPSTIGSSFADRDYTRVPKESGKPFTSAPLYSRISNSAVIVVAVPLAHEGQTAAVLSGTVDLTVFADTVLKSIRIGENGHPLLLSANGDVLACPAHKDWTYNDKIPEAKSYRELVRNGRELDSFVDSHGIVMLTYMKKHAQSGTAALVQAPEAELHRGLGEIRNQTLLVLLVSMAVGSVVVLLIVRPVTRAVKQSADFAREIAGGELHSTLHIKRSDELGALADALREIPEELRQILDAYTDLEDKILHGSLNAQADESRFRGAYAELLHGTDSIIQRYNVILDSIPTPIAIMSVDRKVIFLNKPGRAYARFDDYVGKSNVFSREDAGTPGCALSRCLESGKTASAETRIRVKEKVLDVGYSNMPLLDNSGKMIAVLMLFVDMTEVKNTQRLIVDVAGHAVDISHRLAVASDELSVQVNQMSAGAERQRRQAASTSTAMEEMDGAVAEVARSAGDAGEQARLSHEKASDGEGVVRKVITSINEVNRVTQELQKNMFSLGRQAEAIGGVMNVISDIADQTNLLALNAAIEAARAGEAGRGFAVVADEVRKLAEKTMTATTEVGNSIRGIQTSTQDNARRFSDVAASVAQATELAETSGEALHQILTLADRTSEAIAGIATASGAQSATSREITRSISEIRRVADETAGGMELSAAAVLELAHLAKDLEGLLERLQNTP